MIAMTGVGVGVASPVSLYADCRSAGKSPDGVVACAWQRPYACTRTGAEQRKLAPVDDMSVGQGCVVGTGAVSTPGSGESSSDSPTVPVQARMKAIPKTPSRLQRAIEISSS